MKAPPDFGVDDSAMIEVEVPNDLRRCKEPEQDILDDLIRCGYDRDTTFGIKLAFEEAIINAVKHGNGSDPSKCIVIRYHVDPGRAVIMVRDEGNGFRPDTIPDPTTTENLERPDGRGIMLIQSYMTEVRFNTTGNEVWMLKQKQDDPA